jgi:hypothetical protein
MQEIIDQAVNEEQYDEVTQMVERFDRMCTKDNG